MSRIQIIEETPCEHGKMKYHEWGWPDNGQSCPGGDRRVLTETQAPEIGDDRFSIEDLLRWYAEFFTSGGRLVKEAESVG